MAKSTEEVNDVVAPNEVGVAYLGDSDVRVLTGEELSGIGVTHKDGLRWDAANGKVASVSKTNADALVKAAPREFGLV